jgi:hypothetical protein
MQYLSDLKEAALVAADVAYRDEVYGAAMSLSSLLSISSNRQ